MYEKLVASKKFRIFTRGKLDKALSELKLQMKDLFDPETAKKVGKFVGADLLVLMEGYIRRGSNGDFRVKIMAIDVETAEVKSVWKKWGVR